MLATLIAQSILSLAAVYLICGLVVGIPMVAVGLGRLDTATKSAPLGFRLVILPGCVAFWPLLVVLWLKKDRSE